MAKTIKFNLICDEKPIRTIEDLQDNFSIEDVLTYYKNGLLQRWLEVRGYEKELQKVNAIKSEDSLEIIKELIKIFEVVSDQKKIEEDVYMIEFVEEHKELCSLYEQNKFKAESIIDDYQTGYKQLVHGILDNPNDVARIKANIEEMAANYRWALDLNHRELFWMLYKKSVLAIMCLLMNDKTRDYFLPIELEERDNTDTVTQKSDDISAMEATKKLSKELISATISTSTVDSATANSTEKKYDILKNPDKKNMYDAICELPTTKDFAEKLGDNLIKFAGVTEGYWKDLEPKGKKYMIISMGSGDFVRSAGESGGDLSSTDVTDAFVIVDGVDYKSNSASRQLLYMEV